MGDGKWAGNLSLANITSPQGFASLAAAVTSMLREQGRAFLYVDEQGNILHKDPNKEVAICQAPVLIVDPSAIVAEDEANETITVSLKGVQVLHYSGLVLDVPEEEKWMAWEEPADENF